MEESMNEWSHAQRHEGGKSTTSVTETDVDGLEREGGRTTETDAAPPLSSGSAANQCFYHQWIHWFPVWVSTSPPLCFTLR